MLIAPAHVDVVERLLKARETRAPIPTSELASLDIDENGAYQIQAAVCARAGAVGAWKTGRKSAEALPIMAPILAATVRSNPAVFKAGELRLIGIELEIAFRLEADLPNTSANDFESQLAERVSALAAIEVVDSRLADFQAAGPLWRLADNQINGGLVTGQARSDWHDWDLSNAQVELVINGRTAHAGSVPVPGGCTFGTFCAFARRVGEHAGGLRRGQVVTTGSLTGMDFVDPGSEVIGRISGLGEVKVSFPPG